MSGVNRPELLSPAGSMESLKAAVNGGNYDSGETTTTTKVYTDIPSFSPLIFQIYIEPDGK